jgi:RimJ/RimL family protein N-acetyltransferase
LTIPNDIGPARIVKASSPPRCCELQLVLEPALGEVLRAFVREASLAEGVPVPVANLIADDAAQAWLALCAPESDRERVHIALLCSHQDVRTRILLHGHSRFSSIVASLAGRVRPDAGISCREHGIDGWAVSLHRSLAGTSQPPLSAAESAPPATAAPVAAGDCHIDLPQKSDAAAIARCFLAVYGHHYVHAEVFSTHRYWDKVERGELIPAIARDARGEVIGHVALEREPDAQVAERGEAVVLAAYRGHHLLERMTERLSQEAPRHGLHRIYAEPLTIHTFSQRNDERAGMSVCAVLLGANPESFRPKGLPCPTAGQRQSYLRTFRFVQPPAARTIHAPEPYRDMVLRLYASLGVQVSVAAPAAPSAPESRTGIKLNDRGYGVIHFERIGAEAAVELGQALRDVRALGAAAVQLSAPVGDPGLPLLTDAARGLGFFFCGLGPAFADGTDTFLLQALSQPLDTGKLQLLTDLTKELVAFIDRHRAATAPGA